MPRRIAIITGTRAEYGLLSALMHAVDAHRSLELQCIVAGTHLMTESWRDIEFPAAARVRMQQKDRVGRHHDAVALGRGVMGFAEAFASLKPDIVVVLGDRIEAFAAASSASVAGVCVAHIHGGDRAEGVADEAMRHAITKLAHLHFPATAQSKRRIIRMGEDPSRIFNHGSPAVDGLANVAADPDAPQLIIMQHPIGDADETERRRMAITLNATKKYSRLIMAPNHDPGRDGILQAIHDAGLTPTDHLHRPRFLSLLKGASAIVGNSSAGLIEAAILKTSCVNLGPRQSGRQTPNNTTSLPHSPRPLTQALQHLLASPQKNLRHPYGNQGVADRITQTLNNISPHDGQLRKQNSY